MSTSTNSTIEASDKNNQRSLMNRLSFGLLGEDDQATTESSEIESPEVEATVENTATDAVADNTAE